MKLQALLAALGLLGALPAATHARPAPEPINPAESADARFCMRVGPWTGINIERTRCWTRQQWADQGVDLEKEWLKEGVRILR